MSSSLLRAAGSRSRCWAALLLGAVAVSALAQDPVGSRTPEEPALLLLPRPRPRPVRARQGMVASAHPLASAAGVEVLQAGGSAIDALVATQMVLNVVEPGASGIGGGCFILYHDAKSGTTHCIDGREEVPAPTRRADFLDRAGNVRPEANTGGLPVGVPGTVAAMWQAHGRWGRLPMPRVLERAIRHAEQGVGVTPHLRRSITENRTRLARFPSSRAVFLSDQGQAPELGTLLRQPDLARTLQLLAADGPRAFYEGPLAESMVRTVRHAAFQPGRLTLDDLRGYRAVPRTPIRFRYRGYEVVGAPPPSSGAITLGLMLGILEEQATAGPAGSVEELDNLARAGALAFADRNAYLGDPDWSPEIDMRGLLAPEFLRARIQAARQLRPGEAAVPGVLPRSGPVPAGAANPREGEHTSHLSIVDADRNVVSCTTTIEHWMGSGLVVEGRGFLLNNELTDFDLHRETGPNALDTSRRPRRSALADSEQPAGKRPRSSMTPVIVFRDGRPYLTAGSPGGSYIIGIVAQVLHNVLDHGMDMQQALSAPRLSSQNRPLELEWHYPHRAALVAALQARGWQVRPPEPSWPGTFGNAHGIRLLSDGTLEGGADVRLEGAARGY